MIKNALLIAILCIHAITMMAQKNYLKTGGGIGNVPYEGTLGLNVELQYEYKMLTRLSGFLSLGMNSDKFTLSGRSQGIDGTETWDNSWQYQLHNQFSSTRKIFPSAGE